jgi:RNA polymerase sigma-19 factor, ECF subfamily
MEKLCNERELLSRIAAGDEAAFGELFHHWRDKLYFFILRITDSPEMAEDVFQDVFVKLWINRNALITIQHFDAYLYTMTHHHAISGMRRMARETLILAELRKSETVSGPAVDETVFQRELTGKLQAILRKLPTQQRLVYTMTRDQGLKQEEIAKRLKISASTVKNHMTRALHTIREELRQHYHSISLYLFVLMAFFRRP